MFKKKSLKSQTSPRNLQNLRFLFFFTGLLFVLICQIIKITFFNQGTLASYRLNHNFSFFPQIISPTFSIFIVIFILSFLLLLLFSSNFWIILFAVLFFAPGFSNLIDRLSYGGAVFDYIKLSWNNKTFWFNLEDLTLLITSIFLIIFLIKNYFYHSK